MKTDKKKLILSEADRFIKQNTICIEFKISEKIIVARIVAVNGCINNPIEPLEADILPIPKVIKNWPPNWHKNAKSIRLAHSKCVWGKLKPDSKLMGIIENRQQNNVV